MFKKFLASSALVGIIFTSMITAFAASGTYESTYDLTGGLNSRIFDASGTPIFVVDTFPEIGVSGSTLTLYLKKKTIFGDADIDSGTVSSTAVDSETLYKANSGEGDYYVRFRNWTGHQMKGDVVFNYSW